MNWKKNIKDYLADYMGLDGEYSLMILTIYLYSHLMGKIDAIINKITKRN